MSKASKQIEKKHPVDEKANLHDIAWGVQTHEDFKVIVDKFVTIHERFENDREAEIEHLRQVERETRSLREHLLDNNQDLDPFHVITNSPLLSKYAVVCVDHNAKVLETNAKAKFEYSLQEGKSLEENGVDSFEASGMASQLDANRKSRHIEGEFDVIQTFIGDAHLPAAVAVMPMQNGRNNRYSYLVVFLNSSNLLSTTTIIANRFDLTKSETSIATAVLAGKSLREIAKMRNRTYKTIRNQFQTILEKTNCNSKTNFLRLVSDVSFFVNEKSKLTSINTSKNYKAFEVPRPKGRKVEVKLCGDLSGKPIIAIPDIMGHTISPEMNEILNEEGYYWVSISPPGNGVTTPAPKDVDRHQCFIDDVLAIMDNLEIQRCPIIGRASGVRPAFKLLRAAPERFTYGFSVGSNLPRNYQQDLSTTSKWTRALISITLASRPVLKVIMTASHRILMNAENPGIHLETYFRSAPDHEYLRRPGVGEVLRVSFRENSAVYSNDIRFQDLYESLIPWGEEAAELEVPMLIIYGDLDTNLPISEARSFAQAYPETLSLETVKGAGSLLFHSHFRDVMNIIKKYSAGVY